MHYLLLLSNGIDVYGKEGPRQVIMLPNCTTPTTGAIALYLPLFFSSTWNKTFYRFSIQERDTPRQQKYFLHERTVKETKVSSDS